MLELKAKEWGEFDYEAVEKDILLDDDEEDTTALADCRHYVEHSVVCYPQMILKVFHDIGLNGGALCFHRSNETVRDDDYWLSSIGLDQCKLCYVSLHNNLAATVSLNL